jgi:uncharacterized Fe-S cluster-containing protein
VYLDPEALVEVLRGSRDGAAIVDFCESKINKKVVIPDFLLWEVARIAKDLSSRVEGLRLLTALKWLPQEMGGAIANTLDSVKKDLVAEDESADLILSTLVGLAKKDVSSQIVIHKTRFHQFEWLKKKSLGDNFYGVRV